MNRKFGKPKFSESCKNNWQSRHVYAFMVILSSLCLNALADNICPMQVETQQLVTMIPTGYEVEEDAFGRHRITFIEVYDGPVKEMVSLVPDEDLSNESRWMFGGVYAKRGIQVACHYSWTRLVLVKKLKIGTKSCVAKYRSKKDGLIEGVKQIASLECQ